jgi:glycosyltransferase involved in cell wall biosynthesis
VRGLWRLYHLAWWPQRALLNRADAVVAVSHTTAALIAEHRLTSRPVHVVPNAPVVPEGLTVGARTAPAKKTLVYMGSFMPYKNVETLAQATELLPGYELHLMSRVTDAQRERLVAAAPGAALVFHDGASDEEYFSTLLEATALVTSSLDEGFGIPVVEAMSVGTPVVVSDIPIFREIGGAAAAFFPADDPAALAHEIRLLEDPALWRERSARGRAQAARYSWADSAAALLGVLRQTVDGR